MLAAAAVAAVSLPFALGVVRAQTLPPTPTLTYDTVSVHKTAPGANHVRITDGPQGGWRTENTSVVKLISASYHVEDYQIVGAPGWASTQGFDVMFTPDKNEPALGDKPTLQQLNDFTSHNAQRMQAVLRDRFGLILRSETRELPIYNLVQAKGGHKLSPHDPSKGGPSSSFNNGREVVGADATSSMLAELLAMVLKRPVVDETHVDGQWDFRMKWTPDSEASNPDASAPGSIFTEITDQLGLKLDLARGPVQVYVVEKIEQPTEN